jgi:hypothetical protein
LQTEAGKDPLQDKEFVGYIKAVRDLLLVDVEDVVKETE